MQLNSSDLSICSQWLVPSKVVWDRSAPRLCRPNGASFTGVMTEILGPPYHRSTGTGSYSLCARKDLTTVSFGVALRSAITRSRTAVSEPVRRNPKYRSMVCT
jgi:hypothetical protein